MIKNKEHIKWLENIVAKEYGSRCPDFHKDCYCCQAWEFFDSVNNLFFPKCDWHGTCKNKAFREVYPKLSKINKKGWSFLCKKHFYLEQKQFKKQGKKLAWAGLEEIETVRNCKISDLKC